MHKWRKYNILSLLHVVSSSSTSLPVCSIKCHKYSIFYWHIQVETLPHFLVLCVFCKQWLVIGESLGLAQDTRTPFSMSFEFFKSWCNNMTKKFTITVFRFLIVGLLMLLFYFILGRYLQLYSTVFQRNRIRNDCHSK